MTLSLSLDEVCAAVPAATGELLGRVADVATRNGFGPVSYTHLTLPTKA